MLQFIITKKSYNINNNLIKMIPTVCGWVQQARQIRATSPVGHAVLHRHIYFSCWVSRVQAAPHDKLAKNSENTLHCSSWCISVTNSCQMADGTQLTNMYKPSRRRTDHQTFRPMFRSGTTTCAIHVGQELLAASRDFFLFLTLFFVN